MGQLIKQYPDGSFLEYDRGGFDDWCVYLTDASGNRKPPRDTDYFTQLKNLAERFGTDKVYNDYVKVYDLTGKQVSKAALDCMDGMCRIKTTPSISRSNLSMTFVGWTGSGKGHSQKHKVQKIYSEMDLINGKSYGIYTMTQFGIRRKPRWNSKQDRL